MNHPFNKAKYTALLEGLEISIVSKSSLERTVRFDSEFCLKEFLLQEEILNKHKLHSVDSVAKVTDGNHMSISDRFREKGIPYYRGQDIHNFFIEHSSPICIDSKTFNIPHLKRSHLEKGDVLLSIVGTIGGVSVVGSNKPATCNCKLAIFRPQSINGFFLATYLKTKYGQNQIKKHTRGAVQKGLILEDMDQILVPDFSFEFQNQISILIENSKEIHDSSKEKYQKAEALLLENLGLKNFNLSKEAVNIKSFKESFEKSGRLDAEFYQKKYDDFDKQISINSNIQTIENIREFNSRGLQPVYVKNGSVNVVNSKHIMDKSLDYENFEKTTMDYWNLQKRARIFKGDILTYTTGANIGRTQVFNTSSKALASNHVNILRVKPRYNPFFIGFVMNSKIGRIQTEKLCAGSAQSELYPRDIDQFIIPIIEDNIQKEILKQLDERFILEKQSKLLLNLAKTAVEKAIETSEPEAMAYINEKLNELDIKIN